MSTDGWASYPNAILDTFGGLAQHGVIIENYQNPEVGRYAPPDIAHCDRRRVQFIENLMTICTSHIERFNCTTRQFVKRFCRLTLAFSKKLANLEAAVSLYICYYNWCWRSRVNDDQKGGKFRPTPAMPAGLTDKLWKIEDPVRCCDGIELIRMPNAPDNLRGVLVWGKNFKGCHYPMPMPHASEVGAIRPR